MERAESGKIDGKSVPLTEEQIRDIAIGAVAGSHFISWQLPERDMNLLQSIFMPFIFMDEIDLKEFTATFAHVVGLPGDRIGMAINGYPIHSGMQGVTQTDAEKIIAKIKLVESI